MLYGHVESLADRVDHLAPLRALQDETRGFVGFVPLPYHPENNQIAVDHGLAVLTAFELWPLAGSISITSSHITAYWVALGLKLAQVALSYGADDLHGTILEERIFHMAGASSPQLQTETEMIKAISRGRADPRCSGTLSMSRLKSRVYDSSRGGGQRLTLEIARKQFGHGLDSLHGFRRAP
jgi:aminodeoxyfutalosine synthase